MTMCPLSDAAWADEWDRELAHGENPSRRTPELILIGGQPEGSWQREIVLIWKAIDALQDPVSGAMNEHLYRKTWVSIHRSYLHCLNAERERLLAGVLKDVDLDISESDE
ncbi:hypothetical protein [Paraburkholderia caribensis]|uniref:hypothetical protein n=1 Tax=Paraburkholderia caribensis TaxID=75105 RepID=UPI000B12EA1D|nr:hypothetical protein [Paraburkholderia caribensis]